MFPVTPYFHWQTTSHHMFDEQTENVKFHFKLQLPKMKSLLKFSEVLLNFVELLFERGKSQHKWRECDKFTLNLLV